MFFLDDKSQVQKIFKNFSRKAQNQCEVKIKKVRSNIGTKLKNANGVVERNNQTLIEMARIMLDEYKTPKHFWAEAVETTCHATNCLYLHRLLGKTAYELLTGKKTPSWILSSIRLKVLYS